MIYFLSIKQKIIPDTHERKSKENVILSRDIRNENMRTKIIIIVHSPIEFEAV